MNSARTFRGALAAIAAVLLAAPAAQPLAAQDQGLSFDAYLQLVAAKARGEGISDRAIAAVLSGLTPNQRVIDLDRSQPGGTPGVTPPLAPYLATHVDAARIGRGRAMRDNLGASGEQIVSRYGVPLKMVLAIWGHETNYGSYMGDFDLARSLATLAWEGRRRGLFEGELIALIKMADRGVPRSRLTGSWAGAFGNPQFLPSVYLRLAQDGDGDGMADIWTNRADTLASIANYFRDAGWRPGEPWGVRAAVPAGFANGAVATRLNAPGCTRVHERHSRWQTVAEWRAMGVVPQAFLPDSTMATLIEPDGRGQPAWLLTGNYRVILQYNCSNFYALSVGLLADEIAR